MYEVLFHDDILANVAQLYKESPFVLDCTSTLCACMKENVYAIAKGEC